ncbi:putative transcriptional regulator [Herbaspirillum sp. YR522]|nr:putative transcriptional regulator [Herbaspirillum sp. YR522]
MSMEKENQLNAEFEADALQLGARLRHARRLRNLTLKECADTAGCSEGQLSKVERGVSAPSLALLHRLAHLYASNVSELLGKTAPNSSPVLLRGSRPTFGRNHADISLERMDHAAPGSLLQAHIHIIPVGAKSDGLIEHVGEEVGYVLEGTVKLTIGGETYVLTVGDGFHFPSQMPHGYENIGADVARIYWVNTPATF